MNSDPQFWTAFKEAAQAGPQLPPAPGQWELLEAQLPTPKRRSPWLAWLFINLFGLCCIGTMPLFTQPPLNHIPLSLPSNSLEVVDTLLATELQSAISNEGASAPLPPPILPQANQSAPIPNAPAHQATTSVRQYSPQTVQSTSATSNQREQNSTADNNATAQLAINPIPFENAIAPLPINRLPSISPLRTSSKKQSPHLSVSLHLQPFANFDNGQGLLPSIGLTTHAPLGFRASFRLSQVQTSWQWTDLTANTISYYRSQAPGLLLDATRTDRAILFSLAISRPLLRPGSRLQISPLIGTALALHQRSEIELLSFAEYGTLDPTIITQIRQQRGLNYWNSFLGLDVHYRLKARFDLVIGGRFQPATPRLPADSPLGLQLGLSYRIR